MRIVEGRVIPCHAQNNKCVQHLAICIDRVSKTIKRRRHSICKGSCCGYQQRHWYSALYNYMLIGSLLLPYIVYYESIVIHKQPSASSRCQADAV
eukprot:6202925-Pleurochrysis_carterae.AAC.1